MSSVEIPVSPAAVTSSLPALGRCQVLALGAVLTVAVLISGLPLANAPWLQGDEHIFIVENQAVTGAGLAPDTLFRRLVLMFEFPPEEDLYQPLPILSYALQWILTGNSPVFFRVFDMALHAVNAVLLWAILYFLLRRSRPAPDQSVLLALTWGLTLVWALHPILVSAWAADMGRTHVMAATFALLSLLLHVRSIEQRRPALFVAAVLCLIGAMLSKVLVGWVLLVAALEAWLVGGRRMLRSPRIYIIAALCVLFGAAAYYTGSRVGLIQDASAGLMGDPVSRSALAVWLYVRNTLMPLWLSPWWYLPDPLTNWSNPRVWLGLALATATAVHVVAAWRRPERRAMAVGWAWFWAALLPVVGLVGTRESAAADRYMYVPLMGLMLVAGAVALPAFFRSTTRVQLRPRAILVVAGVIGAVLLVLNQPVVRICRRPVGGGLRALELYPGNPRALEALAAAYNFARNHALPAEDLALVPAGQQQADYFGAQRLLTLRQAAQTPDLPYYFPGPVVQAAFHRRLSAALADARQYGDALAQAQVALQLNPNSYSAWVRLAHAYRGVQDFQQAEQAYERCELMLPADPISQATHYANYGRLLLFDLERADLAFPKFRRAIELKRQVPARYQRELAVADIGLARCEIREGQGERGYQLVTDVLKADPQNILAGLVLAEYYFRSEKWQPAAALYEQLIRGYPLAYPWFDWYYEALRGYEWVCIRTGNLQPAAAMWGQAVRLEPTRRESLSFRAWSLALAGDGGAPAAIDELLTNEPDNQLGCLGQAILALRAGEIETAIASVERARAGQDIPRARAFERTLWAIERLKGESTWPPETGLLEAAISMAGGWADGANQALEKYSQSAPDSSWLYLAQRIRSWSVTAPASSKAKKIGG